MESWNRVESSRVASSLPVGQQIADSCIVRLWWHWWVGAIEVSAAEYGWKSFSLCSRVGKLFRRCERRHTKQTINSPAITKSPRLELPLVRCKILRYLNSYAKKERLSRFLESLSLSSDGSLRAYGWLGGFENISMLSRTDGKRTLPVRWVLCLLQSLTRTVPALAPQLGCIVEQVCLTMVCCLRVGKVSPFMTFMLAHSLR
jgi:hypothetical protein